MPGFLVALDIWSLLFYRPEKTKATGALEVGKNQRSHNSGCAVRPAPVFEQLMDGRRALPNPAAVGRFAPNCTAAVLRTPANVRQNRSFALRQAQGKLPAILSNVAATPVFSSSLVRLGRYSRLRRTQAIRNCRLAFPVPREGTDGSPAASDQPPR